MKTVIGIDESHSSRFTLDLLLKLKFDSLEVILVYVIESVMPDGSFVDFPDGHPLGDLMGESFAAANEALSKASALALVFDVKVRTKIVKGNPAEALQEVAASEGADLIAVGNNRRSKLDDLLLGSTARTLLHESPSHLLIGRNPVLRTCELATVFAIDRREGAGEYANALLDLGPRGFGHIDLLTVNQMNPQDLSDLKGAPGTPEDLDRWIGEGLERENALLADSLAPLGAECRPTIVEGEMPACSIVIAANRARADLIVVGARPHGFLDRHLRRSVSEGLLASDRRGLLVLRPNEK